MLNSAASRIGLFSCSQILRGRFSRAADWNAIAVHR